MKLRVEDITEEVKYLAFSEPEEEVNHLLRQGPVCDYQLEGPVAVELSYYRCGTELIFQGALSASALGVCGRCAESYQAVNYREFRFVFAPAPASSSLEADASGEDLELTYYNGDTVDLSPLLREQVILSLPIRPLCEENCRGLCAGCGANLNRETCRCAAPSGDPRLESLRNLTRIRLRS